MSSIVISGDTSGAITLAAPSVAGTNTATLPASTGTVMVSGNMPAFSYYASSGQSVTTGNNKVLFGTKEFDTNNNVSSSRFTPTVAGYYYLNSYVSGSWANQEVAIYIYKNGNSFKNGTDIQVPTGGLNYGVGINCLVYANGSSDYFEIYIYSGNNQTLSGVSTGTYFTGSMVRSA
jgi:hypothetical protein